MADYFDLSSDYAEETLDNLITTVSSVVNNGSLPINSSSSSSLDSQYGQDMELSQFNDKSDANLLLNDEGIVDFPDLLSLSVQNNSLNSNGYEDLIPLPKICSNTTTQGVSFVKTDQSVPKRTTSRSSDEGIGLSPQFSNFDESNEDIVLNIVQPSPVSSVEEDENIVQITNFVAQRSQPEAPTITNTTNVETPNDPNEKCHVCKEKAGKHSYYGGRVCPSCRAFFRRAVQSKYYEIFFCSKGEKCEINLKTRRSCQFCRFKKCLDSGMRIAWVLPDGERNRRFNKLNKLAKRNSVLSEKKQVLVPIQKKTVSTIATNDELKEIEITNTMLNTYSFMGMKEFLLRKPGFLKELASLSYFGGKMSQKFFQEFNELCSSVNQKLYYSIDEFRQLPISDRKTLVEQNGPVLNRFICSVCIQEVNSCLTNRIEEATKSGQYPELQDINDQLEAMNLGHRKPLLAYSQFFVAPWAANNDDEKRHFYLMQMMKAWPRDNLQSPVDELQLSLMKIILAFNTDSVKLERPDIVEKVQLRYAYLLHRYLKFKYGKDGNRRFTAGLMMAAYARETNEIYSKRDITV